MRIKRGERLALVAFLTFFAVFQSLSAVPVEGGPNVPGLDKMYHFCFYLLYFLAVFGLSRSFCVPPRSSVMVGVFAAVALGSFEEFIQSLVPGRLPEALDLLADVTGALSGVALVLWRRALRSG